MHGVDDVIVDHCVVFLLHPFFLFPLEFQSCP